MFKHMDLISIRLECDMKTLHWILHWRLFIEDFIEELWPYYNWPFVLICSCQISEKWRQHFSQIQSYTSLYSALDFYMGPNILYVKSVPNWLPFFIGLSNPIAPMWWLCFSLQKWAISFVTVHKYVLTVISSMCN